MSSLEYLKLSLYVTFRYVGQYYVLYYVYIYIFFHKYDSFLRNCLSWVFLLGVIDEFVECFQYRSVISIELLCLLCFVGVFCAQMFCEFAPYFQGSSQWEDLHLFFAKALLSLIVHFKSTCTYCHHCFVHYSEIFKILHFYWLFITAATFA